MDELAQLRHLYSNLLNGGVRDTASAKSIATGLLGPVIESLERASEARAAPHPAWCSCGACNPEDAEAVTAAREQEGKPAYMKTCQEGGDLCRAGQRDGVTCPEESCDIDDELRPKDEASATGAEPTEDEKEAQRRDWTARGGFFHRFDGEDHACIPLKAWRATPTSAPVQAEPPEFEKTFPDQIWLDVGDDARFGMLPPETFRDLVDVTWSEDNATGFGVKYVRADLTAPTRAAYRTEMGDAAERYCESFRGVAPNFPGPWRWQELWEAMLDAASPSAQEPTP
jgi:hypothetical protein